jgi:DNA-binding response OmpR family regulator
MYQAKILVADDSRTVRKCLERFLTAAGFDVFLAGDGLEAVHLAQDVHPDLVILDIQMPEMDGYEACDLILQNGSLPIVFLTKDQAPHLSVLGDQLGAYLPKPAEEHTLVNTVRNLLQRATQTC